MTMPSPRDGDRVFHCGHFQKNNRHFFQAEHAIKVHRPDKTVTEGSWIVVCDACLATGKDLLTLIRGDRIWKGASVDYKEPS